MIKDLNLITTYAGVNVDTTGLQGELKVQCRECKEWTEYTRDEQGSSTYN